MKKQLMALVGVVAVCMLLAVVSNVMAADANQPKGKPKDRQQFGHRYRHRSERQRREYH